MAIEVKVRLHCVRSVAEMLLLLLLVLMVLVVLVLMLHQQNGGGLGLPLHGGGQIVMAAAERLVRRRRLVLLLLVVVHVDVVVGAIARMRMVMVMLAPTAARSGGVVHFGAQRQHIGQIVAFGAENVRLCSAADGIVVVEIGMMVVVLLLLVRREHVAAAVMMAGRCRVMITVVGGVRVTDEVLVGGERQLVDAVIRIDDVQLLARLARQIRGLRIAPEPREPGAEGKQNGENALNTRYIITSHLALTQKLIITKWQASTRSSRDNICKVIGSH